MKNFTYTFLLGLALLTGCQWNLEKTLFNAPCIKPSAEIVVQQNQLKITVSLAGKKGEVSTATWDFGENKPVQTGETITYTYDAIGPKTIKLVLTNRCNDRIEFTKQITVDQEVPPQLETLDPASIGTDKATLGLRFTSLGRSMIITEFGYCYSDTKILPTVDDNARPLSGTATVNTSFTAVQTGLISGKVYNVRAYCKTNKTDPQYGQPKSFTITIPIATGPVVETGAFESVTSSSATLKMTLKSFTTPLYRVGVCYSKNTNPAPGKDNIMFIQETNPALREYSFNTGDKTTDPVTYNVPLEANTTYYYVAFGVTQGINNIPNTEKLEIGTVKSFKTLAGGRTNTFFKSVAIYTGNENGKVYAYSSDGVTKLWDKQLTPTADAIVASPAYANGLIFAAAKSAKKIFALYADTGDEAWAKPFETAGEIISSPTVINNVLYVADVAGKLYLVNATTGTGIAVSNRTVGPIRSSPAVSQGVICVGSDDKNVYGFSATDGTYKWTYTTTGQVRSSPTISGNVVYIGSGDRSIDDTRLHAIDLNTGARIWTYTMGKEVPASPTVKDGIIYVSSRDKFVYAINANGTLKWKSKTPAGDEIFSSPSVLNDLVAVGSDDRKLYLFNQADGSLKNTFDASGGVQTNAYVNSSPVIYDGTIYFGFSDYNVSPNRSTFYGIELNGNVIKMNFKEAKAFSATPVVVNNGVLVGAYPSISGAAQ